MLSPKISVLIPVFNGSKYISGTLDSIIAQQFGCFEIICIDDCSTDNSLEILREYSKKDLRIRVFSTENNMGIVPKVINFGRKFIRGEYYVYSSQDDSFSEDWLDCMYARAIETEADAIIPDLVFWHENEPYKNRILSGVNGDRNVQLNGRQAFLLSLDWTIPGNALWKTWLVREIGYFDFGMNADEYTARLYFLKCNKVAFSGGVFYYRQDNVEAITKKISVKSLDLPFTDLMLWLLARDNGFQISVQRMLLERSVFGLLYFNSLLLVNSDLSSGRYKITRCYDEFTKYRIFRILRFKDGWRNKRILIAKLASIDYSFFFIISMVLAVRILWRDLFIKSMNK